MTKRVQMCPQANSICSHKDLINKLHTIFTRNQKIPVEENGKRYYINNLNHECIAKVKIDGGLISSSENSKADYMVIRCDHNIIYIIELKGSDVKKACSQILSTLKILTTLIGTASIHARIICSRVPAPALRSSEHVVLDKYCKKMNGRLDIKVREYTEVFS